MSLHKHGSMIFVLGRMGNVCRVILYNNLLTQLFLYMYYNSYHIFGKMNGSNIIMVFLLQ